MGKVFAIFMLIAILVGFAALQIEIVVENQRRTEAAFEELNALQAAQIDDEKLRQETLALRIENDRNLILFRSVFTNVSATVGVLVALTGAWVGFSQYLGARQKERTQRNRERLDRAAQMLNDLWKGLAHTEPNIRASSVAGLRQLLAPDKTEFHEVVVSALSLVGRMENDLIVERTLSPVVECAMREVPDEGRKSSWQGLTLFQPDFAGRDLHQMDFRDCILEEGNFQNAILKDCRFDASSLIGSNFDNADLSGARLDYVDFTNASLKGARFQGARLHNVFLLHTDLEGADLQGADYIENQVSWKLAKNWRQATFDEGVKERLMEKHGPPVEGRRVLVVSWEYYPIVAGGGWTALFHLLTNLRKRGVDVAVMVPWTGKEISYYEFGNEIDTIPVGVDPYSPFERIKVHQVHQTIWNVYEAQRGYGPSWSHATPLMEFTSTYSTGPTSSYRGAQQHSSVNGHHVYATTEPELPSLFDRLEQYQTRALEIIEAQGLSFDVILAQDWITFGVARAISEACDIPWLAHFHSTEADRQDSPSSFIETVEEQACLSASHIIAPSEITRQRLAECYSAALERISVVPNCLSTEGAITIPLGEFQTARVIFVGRLCWQKGIDLFVSIAHAVYAQLPETEFVVFGRGEMLKSDADDLFVYEDYPTYTVDAGAKNQESKITISRIIPIHYDPKTRAVVLLPEIDDKDNTKRLAKTILDRGFEVHPIPYLTGTQSWQLRTLTHRIVVNATDDQFHTNYLIRADGLKQLRDSKRKQIIQLEGFMDWRKRKKAFEHASVVVVPSRFEPFGMVVLEAMQAGVPVLFPETAGVNEEIESGIRIDPEDIEGTAQIIADLLTDREHWQQVVDQQTEEIAGYHQRNHEATLLAILDAVASEEADEMTTNQDS